MEMNERTDLATLAKTVKKKVNGLMGVYSLLILLTIILFLVVKYLVFYCHHFSILFIFSIRENYSHSYSESS